MKKELTIIQVNDTHGYIEEHWEHFFNGKDSQYIKVGGYPRLKTYIDQTRRSNENVLFLDSGDTFHGTYPVVASEGEVLIPLLNKMTLDAMTSHWEFAYGPKRFKELASQLNYPVLAINIYDEKTNELVFDPYLIKEFKDVKVGIIGIAATIVDKVMPEHFSQGLYFTLGEEELAKYIKELREDKDVDIIVVLSHLGYPQEVKLAKEVDGIDVLLSGHTHNRLYEAQKVNGALIIQSGCHGSFLGHLDITLDDKKIIDCNYQLKLMDSTIDKDPAMKALVENTMAPYRNRLDQVLGKTETSLSRTLVLESTMDNFLLNAILDYTGSQIAFSNGWRYGAPIPVGDITENDLWNIIPVNPPISQVKLSGREIWDMLEENLERTFATDPYKQMGGYLKRAMGINVYFKIENAAGQRIQYLFINGEAIDYDHLYDVAFVTTQGVPSKYGSQRKNLEINAIDVLKNYLAKEKIIQAPLMNTMVAI